MKVTYVSRKQEALDVYTYNFEIDKKPRHIAGQYIELKLPHENPDERGEKRWFTLSNSPTEELLSITTRVSTDGSSFKKALQRLKAGTILNMAEPMGDFVLPKDGSIPLLFVAGGIGCTPFRSILKYLQDTGEQRKISLLYSTDSEERFAFLDVFDKLNDNFIKQTTRLTVDQINSHLSSEATHVYLSGPEQMVETFEKELKSIGIDERRFHGDFFPGYNQY